MRMRSIVATQQLRSPLPMLGRPLRRAGKDRCHARSKSCRRATCDCGSHGRNKPSTDTAFAGTVEERMGEYHLRRSMLSGKPWRVRVQPMTLAIKPHPSRLWPTCGALLVSSLRTTLITVRRLCRRQPPVRADEVIE